MGHTTITLSVNISTLRTQSKNNGGQPTDNSWATITQTGDGESSEPTDGDPANFLSSVNENDTITWTGIVDPQSEIPDGELPVIGITHIKWGPNTPEGTFSEQQKIDISTNGASTVTVTALKDSNGSHSYTIDFIISYSARFLDPKIKVTKPN
jgi:hypothetical protein